MIVLPSLSCILSIKIGSTNFPPLTKVEYAEVNFNNVVSAEPKDIDNNSSGFSYIPNSLENFTILTSRQLAEGVFGWTKKSFAEVKNVCGMYEKQGIAILGIEADEEEGFILADAESVNALVEEKKLKEI